MRAGISRIAGLSALFLIVAAVPSSGAPQPPIVKFTASGDFSAGANAQAVFSSIGSLDPDLHLALGDLSYGTTGNEQAWCDLVTAGVGAGFPFELIAGNHESNGQNGNINDFSACLPNQLPGLVGTYGRQAYVDVPQNDPLVRYVMISPNMPFPDSTWEYTAGSPRYNWTAAAIDGARTASIPWVVAVMHKPCLAVGDKSCEPGPDLTNMLISKKVDLVLTGHDHSYGRTKQLGRSPGCPAITPNTFNAACVADDDSTMAKGAGTVFATIGTGGVSLRDVNAADPEAPYFAATSGLNSNPTFGSLEVTADADELSARFVRAAGGTFTDAFTIGPGGPPTNQPPVASFTVSCAQLTCSFDGSASS
ncbi:MAG: metallophosphoesterase, partial [Ilumatobacteraceae bacterium]